MTKGNNTITGKKHQEFIAVLQDPSFWSPNFSKISRSIGVSVSTTFDWYRKLTNKDMLACHVKVDIFNEPKVLKEQYERWRKENGMPVISE